MWRLRGAEGAGGFVRCPLQGRQTERCLRAVFADEIECRDAERSRVLTAHGFEVLRFGNSAVLTDMGRGIATIFAAVRRRREKGLWGYEIRWTYLSRLVGRSRCEGVRLQKPRLT